MIIKKPEFEGIMHGNGEQTIFAVTEDSFMNIFFDYPQKYDRDSRYENLYELLPEHCYPELEDGKMYKFEIIVKAIPIDK